MSYLRNSSALRVFLASAASRAGASVGTTVVAMVEEASAAAFASAAGTTARGSIGGARGSIGGARGSIGGARASMGGAGASMGGAGASVGTTARGGTTVVAMVEEASVAAFASAGGTTA